MAAEVLRRRVDDDVGAELQRLLQVRRGEGVVDDDQRAGRVRRLGHRADVDDVQHRVRRRLEPDDPRPLVEVVGDVRVQLLRGNPRERVALRLVDLREHPVDAAVDVGHGDHAVARVQQVHDRRDRAEPRRERDPVLGALERREAELQRSPRRVGDARVVVALVLADRVLDERRRLVDRHRDRARGGIRVLSLVDRAGLEVHDSILVTAARPPGHSYGSRRKA